MTPLHQKLNQLSLTTMSRQLDQTIADAAAKNLSFTQALESSRSGTGIPQPPLHRAPLPPVAAACAALDRQLPLQTSQEPHGEKTASCLLDLEFLDKGTSGSLSWQSGLGKPSCENHWLARLPGQSARSVHHRRRDSTAPVPVEGTGGRPMGLSGPLAGKKLGTRSLIVLLSGRRRGTLSLHRHAGWPC